MGYQEELLEEITEVIYLNKNVDLDRSMAEELAKKILWVISTYPQARHDET